METSIKDSKIRFYIFKERPSIHFVIIDSIHIRLEEKHLPEDTTRSALIKYYAATLAGRAKNKFEDLRLRSDLITERNFDSLIFRN